jgi:DNA repair exonuclease SbcCD ATPase subunit
MVAPFNTSSSIKLIKHRSKNKIMKKNIYRLCFLMLLMVSTAAYSQRYRTTADTGRLNLEYVKVSNDIADLTSKLAAAQSNLPGYQSKANTADANAQSAAAISSDQASKATNGDVGDARSAKRKAKKSFNEAKDARSANKNVSNQDDKIASLTSQLNKKKQRLQELETMRAEIVAKSTN